MQAHSRLCDLARFISAADAMLFGSPTLEGVNPWAPCAAAKPATCYTQVLVGLASASSGATSAGALRQSVPEKTVVGIFRDLRGIAMATNSRRTYGQCLLFQTVLHTFECKHDANSSH